MIWAMAYNFVYGLKNTVALNYKKGLLTFGAHAYSAGNGGQFVGFSLKPLHSTVMASFAYPRHPTRVVQRHSAHFSTAEPSKGPKKANNRLNTLPGIRFDVRQRLRASLFSVF